MILIYQSDVTYVSAVFFFFFFALYALCFCIFFFPLFWVLVLQLCVCCYEYDDLLYFLVYTNQLVLPPSSLKPIIIISYPTPADRQPTSMLLPLLATHHHKLTSCSNPPSFTMVLAICPPLPLCHLLPPSHASLYYFFW